MSPGSTSLDVDDAELRALIERVHIPGWDVSVQGRTVILRASTPPPDARRDGMFDGLADHFEAPRSWDVMQVMRRLFANLQYLTDHELRERFTVDGYRPFDPHLPVSVTGRQKDWFVELESAVRGY